MKLRNSILTYNAIAGVQKINGGILQKIKEKYTPFLYFLDSMSFKALNSEHL